MRPLRPFCGTVLKAQLLTLPATISTSANGVVTTQLSFLPPASSSATDVWGSSESRPATVQPPEPPPTTTKSNVSVTRIPPICILAASALRFERQNSAFAAFMARAVPFPGFGRQTGYFGVTKTSKTRPWAFPKRGRVDTYPSHPRALPGLPSQEASGRDRSAPIKRWPISFRVRFSKAKQRFNAGWSSPVARQAHNLKVIGSNPIPATKPAMCVD